MEIPSARDLFLSFLSGVHRGRGGEGRGVILVWGLGFFGASGLRAFGYCVHHTCRSVSFASKVQQLFNEDPSTETAQSVVQDPFPSIRDTQPTTLRTHTSTTRSEEADPLMGVAIEKTINGEAKTSTREVSS